MNVQTMFIPSLLAWGLLGGASHRQVGNKPGDPHSLGWTMAMGKGEGRGSCACWRLPLAVCGVSMGRPGRFSKSGW